MNKFTAVKLSVLEPGSRRRVKSLGGNGMECVATLLQHAWDSHGRAGNGVGTPLLPDISGPRATAFTSLPLCLMSKLSSASSPSWLWTPPPPYSSSHWLSSGSHRGAVESTAELINTLSLNMGCDSKRPSTLPTPSTPATWTQLEDVEDVSGDVTK